MKKLLLSALAVFAFVAATNAQDFGIKAGVNLANLRGDDVEDTDMKLGLALGGFAEFMISDNIGLQPEILFSMQGYKSEFDDLGTTVTEKLKLSYINIPVLANIYLADNFYIQAGPYLGILASAKQKYEAGDEDDEQDVKEAFKGSDFGAAIGLGVNTGGVTVNARYQLGLANIVDADEADVKNGVIQLSVGFKLMDN